MGKQHIKKTTRRNQIKGILVSFYMNPLAGDDGGIFESYVDNIMDVFKPRKKK